MADNALGRIAEIIMGQSPPGETCNESSLGVPLLNGPTEFGPHHPKPVQFTTDARKKARPGDILFCVRGSTTGRMNWADQEYAIGRGVAAIRHKKGSEYQSFLRAVIEFQLSDLLAQATGSTFPNVSFSQLANVPCPPLAPEEQHSIAHILGTLDDKIELNRRMNETLEAIARAIFKSWFVDFDPVRAKAEGRDPGLPRRIADLFPDSFEDSELGEIPKGWGVQSLGDLFGLDKGLSYKGQFLTEVGVPMVNLGCFLGRGEFAERAVKNYSGEFQARHVIRPRDLVLANTDITQKREIIGSPAIVPPRDDARKMIFTHHVFAARFHEGKDQWKLFIYFLLLQEGFRERAMGFATGTTVLALPRDAVLDHSCPAVPTNIISTFDNVALPLIEREWKNNEESRTLAAIRDTLLPKLISGEIRVKNAERFIRRAV